MTWNALMIRLTSALIVVLAFAVASRAENKGLCPPPPPLSAAAPEIATSSVSATADKRDYGTVTLLAVISDKGYVCSARVLRGPNKETNKKFERAARDWHFDPARKDGHAVPVVATIDVKYHMTGDGQVVSDPPQLSAPLKDTGSKTQ
jgi:TonB family protein